MTSIKYRKANTTHQVGVNIAKRRGRGRGVSSLLLQTSLKICNKSRLRRPVNPVCLCCQTWHPFSRPNLSNPQTSEKRQAVNGSSNRLIGALGLLQAVSALNPDLSTATPLSVDINNEATPSGVSCADTNNNNNCSHETLTNNTSVMRALKCGAHM